MLKFGDSVEILVDLDEPNEEPRSLRGTKGFVVGIYPDDEYPIVVGIEGDGNGELYGFQETEIEKING